MLYYDPSRIECSYTLVVYEILLYHSSWLVLAMVQLLLAFCDHVGVSATTPG